MTTKQRAMSRPVDGIVRLTPRYSGRNSHGFWRRVNSLKGKDWDAAYSMGVALQNHEHTACSLSTRRSRTSVLLEVAMNDDFKAQVTMVRNFPSHVGGYDAELPAQKCGEDDYHGQCCFREGWSCAVNAINERLTEMQNIARLDRQEGGR